MGLFGKKKSEEEEIETDGKDSKFSKKPRTRKKKEPPKPWGKKERGLILFFLLLTVGTSAFLSLSARSWKLPNMPRISVPKISLPFLSEETIVIEGRKEDQNKASKAIETFTTQTDKLSGVYGLYVVHLDNGFSYGIYEHDIFQAASLIKLPLIAAMYQAAEQGGLDLDDKYVLRNADKVAGAGSLYTKPAGFEITYRNLIRLMGKESDNTAFNIIRKLLGDAKIDETAIKIGMANTRIGENSTTPEDVGIFFEELWNGNIINEEHKGELLNYLTDTAYESWLAEGIPQVNVAHKYGREVHVVNDAGIVFAEKPFVLVVLSDGVVEREADEIFPKLARGIYEIETTNLAQ